MIPKDVATWGSKGLCGKCSKFHEWDQMATRYRCNTCAAVQKEKTKRRQQEWQKTPEFKVRHAVRMKKYQNAKSPERKALDHQKTRLRRYGLTVPQFQEMVTTREGNCDLCGIYKGLALHVDHCHKTNRVRGLLCVSCNTCLGGLGDSIEGLERALNYLTGNH